MRCFALINNVNYSAKELADIVGGELCGENKFFKKISIDSREKSLSEHCFFAIKGKKFDGADYVEQAIRNGACVIVTERRSNTSVATIFVENAVKALGLLARHHKKNARVIGVTGSYGKTCVKDMIISVLSEKYDVAGTAMNYNNEIGVPLTLLSVINEEFCVVEMGMRALGEIEWLSYISEPDLAVITSCGTAHIELLGSAENIFKAKTEILLHTKSCCVLPCTEKFVELDCKTLNKILVGNGSSYFAEDIEKQGGIMSFKIRGHEFFLKTIYAHNVQNAVIAYAVGKCYGLSDGEIKNGLLKWKQRENRGVVFACNGVRVINDCYNASYESVVSAVAALSDLKVDNVKTAVLLGDMLELGSHAEEMHKSVGRLCKEKKIDLLFAVGRHAKSYIKGFGGGTELDGNGNIIEAVMGELNEGDFLLVKASNAMGFEKIIDKLREK